MPDTDTSAKAMGFPFDPNRNFSGLQADLEDFGSQTTDNFDDELLAMDQIQIRMLLESIIAVQAEHLRRAKGLDAVAERIRKVVATTAEWYDGTEDVVPEKAEF